MFSVFDLLVLSQIQNIGPHRLRQLVSHFGTPSNVIKANAREISSVEGFNKKIAARIAQCIRSTDLKAAQSYAESQLSKLNKTGGVIVTYWDRQYPEALKKIYDPPPLLYMKGDFVEEDRYSVAVVGTRTPSDYGIITATQFSQELVKLGITIVSGLARGIDTAAHWSALKTGGRTSAVIGSGLDIIYPPENKELSDRISKNGVLISEFPMGAKPDAGNFPKRNRIISGLSLGTIIIETDRDGGAMITANTAIDQNREVFAVPGNITAKRSRGCNLLIKECRAKLVENIDDVVTELELKLQPVLKGKSVPNRETAVEMNLFEKSIYDVLSVEPCHIDSLAEKARISITDALVNLLSLEFKGLVKQLPGKMFARV